MKLLPVLFTAFALAACTVTLPTGTTTPPVTTTTPPPAPTGAANCVTNQSVNGTSALAPPQINGALSGTIVDCFGDTFQMVYSQAAEWPYVAVNGQGTVGANEMYYVWGSGPGGINEVWIVDTVDAQVPGQGIHVWRGGGWLLQSPLPAIVPGPIAQAPSLGAPVSTPSNPNPTGPAPVATTALAPLLVGTTVTLPTGTFGSADVPASVTLLQGAGEGQTIIDGTNGIAAGKACLDLQGASGTPSITIKGMTIQHCNGQSVGCVREDGGRSFVIDTVECKNSSSGIGPTVDGDNVTIMNSNIHDNGQCLSEGSMHDIYIGVAPVFTMTNTAVTDAFGTGCNIVKSRALLSVLQGDTLTLNGQGHVDFPNGHTVSISTTTIVLPAGASDTQMLSFCAEIADTITTDQLVTLQGVKFINNNGSAEVYEPNPGLCPNGILDMSSNDNTWVGSAPALSGWSAVKGALTQAQ